MTDRSTHDASIHDAAAGHREAGPGGPGPVDDSQRHKPRRELSPAARRALAEAEARRAEIDRKSREQPVEVNGRGGPDPARYGDWEVKGIASDF
jgi:hypothetical protein